MVAIRVISLVAVRVPKTRSLSLWLGVIKVLPLYDWKPLLNWRRLNITSSHAQRGLKTSRKADSQTIRSILEVFPKLDLSQVKWTWLLENSFGVLESQSVLQILPICLLCCRAQTKNFSALRSNNKKFHFTLGEMLLTLVNRQVEIRRTWQDRQHPLS